MRSDRVSTIVAAGLVMLAASVWTQVLGQADRAGVVLEQVVFEAASSSEVGALRLQASGPFPGYTLTIPSQGASLLVIEIPGATTRLAGTLDLKNTLIPEASIEKGQADGTGVRVRLSMEGAAIQRIEQTGRGLLLSIRRAGPATDGEYRIGVGDKIEINVFGHEDLAKIVEVRSDGTINYPLIGDMRVAGRTAAEIDGELTRVLAQDYLVDPQVSVDVREYQSQWVTIIGEVRNPGKYVLKRNMRVIDVLAEAGGATKEAGSQILVTRQGTDGSPKQLTVDRNRILNQENQDTNILLEHGDILTVGERELFFIRGEVARPGPYQFESGLTVLRAISYAGGFSQFANRKHVDVLRTGAKGVQEKVTVNLKAIEEGKSQDIVLHPGDTVIVPRRVF